MMQILRLGCFGFSCRAVLAYLQPHSAPTVVQVDEGKDETDSGLLLTSASKEQPTIGKVC